MKRFGNICLFALALSLLLAGCSPAYWLGLSVPDEELEERWEGYGEEYEEDWEAEIEEKWSVLAGEWADRLESGTSADKDHYWKVLDSEDNEVYTITDEEQVKRVDALLNDDGEWGKRPVSEDPGDPAYSYIFCQEETLKAGQSPDGERENEELVQFSVSASEDVVTLRILADIPALLGVDLGDYLTFTINVPSETAEALRNPALFTE